MTVGIAASSSPIQRAQSLLTRFGHTGRTHRTSCSRDATYWPPLAELLRLLVRVEARGGVVGTRDGSRDRYRQKIDQTRATRREGPHDPILMQTLFLDVLNPLLVDDVGKGAVAGFLLPGGDELRLLGGTPS